MLLKDRYLNSIANRFGIEERIVRADFRSWRMSKSPQRSRDQADIELAVLSHLARNPTQRRSAGSRLRPDQFSAIERELFFEFLTGSNDIDNILLRPEDAISDLPLWQGVTCDDLEKSFLGYCSSMSVEMNPENSARLFAQIARRRSDDSHCISALRKSFFEKQAHDLEMRIISAEKSGNGQLALELTAQRIVLDKEGAESG